ncbi:MAG TPA: hypothetical protein PLR16_03425 [Bacilli bacterium]|nr:MAG: hypothetical protein BWY97_00890 [Tenericutes bacterium ADurb.BinA124]HPX84319.1 hypothetical protein [Bacilli bacterium]
MNATIIRKRFKFIAIFAMLIVVVLFYNCIALNPVARVFASESNLSNAVVMKYIPTIDDDFSGNRIIVTLQQQYSDINRYIELEDLGVDIEKAGLSISTERQSQINSLNQNEMINENIKDGRAIITNLFNTENKKKYKPNRKFISNFIN